MKQAFFDESQGNDAFLIAGWVADACEWERFNDQWRVVLAENPAISCFKHHQAMSLKGDFKGWTAAARDAKMMALASVLTNYDISGIAAEIKLSTFNAVFNNIIKNKKVILKTMKYTEPYDCCFHGIIGTVLQQEAANGPEVVDFIFDEQTGKGKKNIALYEEFKQNSDRFPFPPELRTIAGSITEMADDGMPQIQAADLLAGQLIADRKYGAVPKPLKMLVAAIPIAKVECYPPGFEDWKTRVVFTNALIQAKANSKEK